MRSSEVVEKLNALAQDSRLSVFRLIMSKGANGICAGDIARTLSISPNTLSFHLKELSLSGLISSTKEGRSVIYTLNVDTFKSLLKFLTEDCCQGHPELCSQSKYACH
jgi:ArsR family transcriptional regulator, arsenate/arsenite/antimonite-responsive transcriptional repressor